MTMIRRVSFTLGFLHLASVIFMGYAIANSTDPAAVMAWLIYLTVDFPVSFGMIPLGHLIDGSEVLSRLGSTGNYSIYRDIDNFWLPAVYLGVVGTLWWFYLPRLAVALFRLVWR